LQYVTAGLRSVCKYFVRLCVGGGGYFTVCRGRGFAQFWVLISTSSRSFPNAMLCPLACMEKDHTIYRPILKCYLIPLPRIYRPLRQRPRLHPRAWWWAPRAIVPN